MLAGDPPKVNTSRAAATLQINIFGGLVRLPTAIIMECAVAHTHTQRERTTT